MNIENPQLPSLPISESQDRFVVGRIFCVGRNYAKHAHEMGADPQREAPFFFTKQPNALRECGARIPYPERTLHLSHEVELVVAIGRSGRCERIDDAPEFIFGYAVGIDLTRRDMQSQFKARQHPWDMSKSFDGAAPVGALRRIERELPADTQISLRVNNETRQSGKLEDMIWSVAEILTELSTYQPLSVGDLIFTGTPSGVGPLVPGDEVLATVNGLPPLTVGIAS